VTPHRREQLLLREDPIGLRCQDEQERELLAGQRHFLPADGHAAPGGVDHQRPEADGLLLHGGDRLSGDDAAVKIAGAGESPVRLLVATNRSSQFPRSLSRASISPAGVWTEIPREAARHDLPERAVVVE
jgi:hypothetical protein